MHIRQINVDTINREVIRIHRLGRRWVIRDIKSKRHGHLLVIEQCRVKISRRTTHYGLIDGHVEQTHTQ